MVIAAFLTRLVPGTLLHLMGQGLVGDLFTSASASVCLSVAQPVKSRYWGMAIASCGSYSCDKGNA